MQVKQIPVGAFEMNCYVISETGYSECLIIDPGDEPERIITYIEGKNLKPDRIIQTHCHIDHARRTSEVQRHFDIPIYIGEEDVPLLESINEQAALFQLDQTEIPEVSGFLKDGSTFSFAKQECRLLHTPGHSPGSFCVYIAGHVFVGDVLFKDSIGRTDLYRGSFPELLSSIRQKLLVLPEDTIVYPGHGPITTIGSEKEKNPFLRPDEFLK